VADVRDDPAGRSGPAANANRGDTARLFQNRTIPPGAWMAECSTDPDPGHSRSRTYRVAPLAEIAPGHL